MKKTPSTLTLPWSRVYSLIRDRIPEDAVPFGVPGQGSVVAGLTGRAVDDPSRASMIVDAVLRTGSTRSLWAGLYPDKPFQALVDAGTAPWRRHTRIVFPWEGGGVLEAEAHVRGLLKALGEDAHREGLAQTPSRYLRFLREFCSYEAFKFTTFSGEGYDEMIVQSNIPFFSLCEHHLVPFFGTAAVGYIPGTKIVGLSKLARAVEMFSRRLQNQERITTQVADLIEQTLKPRGVGVVIRARHLCMEMRGVRKHDTWTTTSVMRGLFNVSHETRQEFLGFLRHHPQ